MLSPLFTTNIPVSTYVIISGSMEPTIKTGSLSIISKAQKNFAPGDIIAFNSPKEPETTIVHRITGISGGKYITKGDNNANVDNWELASSEIQGKEVLSIPYLGAAGINARTPRGFAVLIGIPAFFLLLSFIKEIKDGFEQEIQKRTSRVLEMNSRVSGNSDRISSLI
jgi:signal peptidase